MDEIFEKKAQGAADTLVINADVCDARKVREETLAGYGQIQINADILLESPKSKALFAKYPVRCSADRAITAEGELAVETVNGRKTLGAGAPAPTQPTVLVVNGLLEAAPGAVLSAYAGIVVNGKLFCPESLSGALGTATVNGTIELYPDDCVVLKSTVVLDRYFALRAKENGRYYAGNRVVLLDDAVDVDKLAEKKVTFVTKRALVAESFVERALPLFDEQAELEVVPDGCAFVPGDAVLDEALLRRYGNKLYISGELTVNGQSAGCLEQVEYLKVKGNVLVTGAVMEAFQGITAEYQKRILCAGTRLVDKIDVVVDRKLLEEAEDGLGLCRCVNVTFREDVSPELIEGKLMELRACEEVKCTQAQRPALLRVAQDVLELGEGKEPDGDRPADTGKRIINADRYEL